MSPLQKRVWQLLTKLSIAGSNTLATYPNVTENISARNMGGAGQETFPSRCPRTVQGCRPEDPTPEMLAQHWCSVQSLCP